MSFTELNEFFEKKVALFDCERHGEIECVYFSMFGNGEPYCPICADEQDKREKLEKKQAEVRRLLEVSGVQPRFMPVRYADFQTDGCEAKAQVLEAVMGYAQDFNHHRQQGNHLVLVGGVGTGKTHLASCVAKQLLSMKRRVEIWTLKGLIDSIRTTWRDRTKSAESLYEHYAGLDLLIIDEVGVGSGSSDEHNIAYEIIGRRYDAVKPMIVCSNCNKQDMAQFIGERCVDRLVENGRFLALDWASYRRGKA